MSLEYLIKSYNEALITNEDAVKVLTNLTLLLNKDKTLEDELQRKIKLLDLRTKVINSQIEKRSEELKKLKYNI